MDNILARKFQLRHNIDPCKPTGSTSMQGRQNTETSWKKKVGLLRKKVGFTRLSLTSDLEPRTSDQPRTSNLGPRTSNLGPRTSDLGPRTSDLVPRTSNLGPRTSDLGLRTSDLGPRPRTSVRARCQARSEKTIENQEFWMGKSTISMAIFNSFLYVYQRVFVDWCLEKLGRNMG